MNMNAYKEKQKQRIRGFQYFTLIFVWASYLEHIISVFFLPHTFSVKLINVSEERKKKYRLLSKIYEAKESFWDGNGRKKAGGGFDVPFSTTKQRSPDFQMVSSEFIRIE